MAPSRGRAHEPAPDTYVRFSSLMELRTKAGFRAREMCMRSCSSVRHRAGRAGARHVPLPATPWVLRANLELCPYPAVPSQSIHLPPPGRALHPRIQQGQRPQAPQGTMGWNAEGSPLLWERRPTLPGQLPIFLCLPPTAPKHKHPRRALCVRFTKRFFMHGSRCC